MASHLDIRARKVCQNPLAYSVMRIIFARASRAGLK
jgi:hypothetical protein